MKPATVDELLAEVLTWTLQGQVFTQPGSKRERHGNRVKGQKVFGLSTIKHALAQGLVDVATVSVSPWGGSNFEGGSFTQVKLTAEGRRRASTVRAELERDERVAARAGVSLEEARELGL